MRLWLALDTGLREMLGVALGEAMRVGVGVPLGAVGVGRPLALGSWLRAPLAVAHWEAEAEGVQGEALGCALGEGASEGEGVPVKDTVRVRLRVASSEAVTEA